MTWLKSTQKALYLMDGGSYLQKIDYQPTSNPNERKLDIPLYWLKRSDPPGTLIAELNGAQEPNPSSTGTLEISASRNAFLDMIAYAEGTDRDTNSTRSGYNIMYSFKTFSDFSDHPRQRITAGGITSTAAGRYQFLDETWDDCKRALNLPDFNSNSQDRAALYLIQRRNALEDVDKGDIRGACENLSWEWASLPYDDKGNGRYGQPTVKFKELEKLYSTYLAHYQGSSPAPATSNGVNLNVPYLSQRDNQRDPDKTCNVTCVAMVLKYFGIDGSGGSLRQLEDELDRFVSDKGWSRYVHNDLVKLQQAYGLNSRFTTTATWDAIKQHLANGNPVIMSGKFTNAGHILVLRGYDETGFWVNDPYGEWWSTGYDLNKPGIFDNKGENLHYSYRLCSNVSYSGQNATWAHFPSR